MLNRLHHTNCVECGTPYGTPEFGYHYGRMERGPAYWSDRGLLCSHSCATEHFKRRLKAGERIPEPAPNPLDASGVARR